MNGSVEEVNDTSLNILDRPGDKKVPTPSLIGAGRYGVSNFFPEK